MYDIVSKYVEKLTNNDIDTFAKKNNIVLSEDEINFVYLFIKKNWQEILGNPGIINLERFKDKFSQENYEKINKLVYEYQERYNIKR
jgi:hypothetical protein